MQNLIIVESPKKAQLIQGFLKSKKLEGYKVMASAGHIRDLKEKSFSIDIENNYTPDYEISKDKKSLVKELKTEAQKADMVWLASDEDREGEAIAWHLSQALELDPNKTKRIAFHEITSEAFMTALENPREINKSLVDAQQARRILDRIVGFELSPVLWKRIQKGLSAGRVQSVAARLVVDREREINNFKTTSAFRVKAKFILEDGKVVEAELNHRFNSEEEVTKFIKSINSLSYDISDIKVEDAFRNPSAPFTTSTLQQEASKKLGYSVAQTMRIAQSLYESGHITYMRTDSVNLSNLALNTIAKEIEKVYGKEYHRARQYTTTSKGAQEAHEAIRPTYVDKAEISGTSQEKKLYELIRKRSIASQMAPAKIEKTTVRIAVNGYEYDFILVGEVIKFRGFLELYMESADDDVEADDSITLLPKMSIGDIITLKEIVADQRYSQRPARYTEASMVRELEKLEIGRPSTYATTIQTIQNRGYVEKSSIDGEKREVIILSTKANGDVKRKIKEEISGADKNKLFPTDTGIVVNDFLMQKFPNIVDYGFTAKVEDEFDNVASGTKEWTSLIDDFYKGFHPQIEDASKKDASGIKIGERILGTDPKTNRQVKVTIGRFGPMIQIGTAEEEEKPQFASLKKGQSIETISLEEALELFALPKSLGEYEGKEIIIGSGRFGPYVKYDGAFASISKDIDPLGMSLDDAIKVILDKKEAEEKSLLKTFDDGKIEIRNGRFGIYIKYDGKNYKIPKKEYDAENITEIQAKEIIEKESKTTKTTAKTKKVATKKKTTTK